MITIKGVKTRGSMLISLLVVFVLMASGIFACASPGLLRLNKTAQPQIAELQTEPEKPGAHRGNVIAGHDLLLANFENDCPLRGKWHLSGESWHVDNNWGVRTRRTLESGANGTSSSYCIEYELPPKPAGKPHICVDGFPSFIDKDLTACEGITLFVRADPPLTEFSKVGWCLLLTENGPHFPPEGRAVESWQAILPTTAEWTRVAIPFTAFKLNEEVGIVNRIFDLPEVDDFYHFVHFGEWQGGEKGKIWIDEIRFYSKGEFAPTEADRGTAVSREKVEEQVLRIAGLPIKEEISPREAEYYIQLDGNRVQCRLCPNRCLLKDGDRGICEVRQNIGGKLYTLVYGQPCSLAINPIEKGPIFHMTPGAKSLVVATVGCNLKCKYCQNWQYSQVKPEETRNYDVPPETAVQLALDNGCEAIVFTYTEGTVFYEYMLDVAKLAKQRGLKTVFITNGYINPKPLRQLCRYLDAIKVDLKGFTDEFYQKICRGELEPVLGTLKVVKEEGVWLEIVNLVVPTLNDDLRKIKEMCEWIRDKLGTDVPLHFSRFWPSYKLSRLSGTPVSTLEQAIEVAKNAGLKYVYIGNVPGHDAGNTYCPYCGKRLIRRVGYAAVIENNIVNAKCKFCSHEIPGAWE